MENIYVFYIQYYRDPNSGSTISSERRLYSVPISESDAQYALTDPVIKTQMSKAGSFEFSVSPYHPFYDAWLQMKTIMRVEYAGETIFRGRVLTIDNSPMGNGIKKIHLEGDFAFFMDSVQEGIKKEEDRPELSLETYITQLIDNHNSQMSSSPYKCIYKGLVPGNYGGISGNMQIHGDTRKYQDSGWRTTSDSLSSLQNEFGGYFRTRYDKSSGRCYLDWLNRYFSSSVNSQTIEISENLIDLSSVTEVDNLFTVLVPIGSNEGKDVYLSDSRKYVTVPEVAQWYIDQGRGGELDDIYHSRYEYLNAISNYGIIYKTQTFSNADTADKLRDYAYDWVKNNFVGGVDNFTVSALDIRHIDPNKQAFYTGNLVRCVYPNPTYRIKGGSERIEKTLAFTAIEYKPHTPDQNSYSIGVPNSSLSNKTYGTPQKKSTGGGGGGGGSPVSEITAGGGGGISQNEDDIKMTADEVDYLAWQYVIDARHNNKKYQELIEDGYYEEAQKASWITWAAVVRGLTEDDDDPQYRELNTKVDMILFDGPKATVKVNDILPKPIQQYITKNPLDPITKMTREEKKAMEAAIEMTVTSQVSQMTVNQKLKIAGMAALSDAAVAAALIHDKQNRKTVIDIGVETGLLKDSYHPWEYNPYVHILKVYKGIVSEEDPYGTAASFKLPSVAVEGQEGEVLSQVLGVGAQALPESLTGMVDGVSNIVKFVSSLNAGNFSDINLTASVDNNKGHLAIITTALGLDGSGNKSTLDLDGKGSIIKTRRPLNAGSVDEKDDTTKIDGDLSIVKVGRELEHHDAPWCITLNEPITYTDSEGIVHTLTRSIHAADFHVDEIGSFKTKLGVFDELIAGKATIGELDAAKARIGDLEVTAVDHEGKLGLIQGSALWVKRDHITGVTGDFKIEKDSSGNDVLTIISGGGMKIERNNVAYGIYDNGNLTGGIMVDKINENTTVTKIKGDRVDIEAGQVRIGDTSNVETWMEETGETLDEYSGLIAARATIGQLNALKATVESMDATWLSAQIAGIQKISMIDAYASTLTIGRSLTLSNGLYLESNGVWFLDLTQNGNTYTLTENKLNGDKRKVGDFSRAVSSIDWSWSNGGAKAVVNPQGQTFYSPSYDSWSASGDPTYDKDKKLLKRKFIFEDTEGNTMFSDDITIPANIVENQYKLADVWIQGTGEAVWVPVSSGGGTYYAAGSQQTLYEKGSSYTTVKGSGSWFYTRGSSVTPTKKSGTNQGGVKQTYTYKQTYNSSGNTQGYRWVSSNATGSGTMYNSGSAYTYYDVGSSSTLYKSGSYVHMYDAGDSVTAIGTERKITPISSTSIQVTPGVRYTQGTHYTDRYYTKS